jgi:hypothetical protein
VPPLACLGAFAAVLRVPRRGRPAGDAAW